MSTLYFRGDAAAVQKAIRLNLSNAPEILNISFSPTRQLVLESPDAASVVAAWAERAGVDTMFADITATQGTATSPSGAGSYVWLTHNIAGEDFHVTVSDGEGAFLKDCVWNILFQHSPSGGTFTITVNGQTTAAITYSTVVATLKANILSALEALGGINPGDVTVDSGDSSGEFIIAFAGQYVGIDLALSVDGTNLTGGDQPLSITFVPGSATQNEIHRLEVSNGIGTVTQSQNEKQKVRVGSNVTGGTFGLDIPSLGIASSIPFDINPDLLQERIEAVVGVGNVIVTGFAAVNVMDATVEFTGLYSGDDIGLMTMDTSGLTVGTPGLTTEVIEHQVGTDPANDQLVTYAVPVDVSSNPSNYRMRFVFMNSQLGASLANAGTLQTPFIDVDGATNADMEDLLFGPFDHRNNDATNDAALGPGPCQILHPDWIITAGTPSSGPITIENVAHIYPGNMTISAPVIRVEYQKISDSSLTLVDGVITTQASTLGTFDPAEQIIRFGHDIASVTAGTIYLKLGSLVSEAISLAGLGSSELQKSQTLALRMRMALARLLKSRYTFPTDFVLIDVTNYANPGLSFSGVVPYPVTGASLAAISPGSSATVFGPNSYVEFKCVAGANGGHAGSGSIGTSPATFDAAATLFNEYIENGNSYGAPNPVYGLEYLPPFIMGYVNPNDAYDPGDDRYGMFIRFNRFPYLGAVTLMEVVDDNGLDPVEGGVTAVQDGGELAVSTPSYVQMTLTHPTAGTTYTLSIPFDATAGEVEDLINTVLGAGTVTVTGGPLNTAYIDIEYTGNGWNNKAIATPTIVDYVYTTDPSFTIVQTATTEDEPRGVSSNTFEFVIAPGYGTPGIREEAGYTFVHLRITLPGGRKMATHLAFKDCTPERIQRVINEMLQRDACRVFRTRHVLKTAIVSIPSSGSLYGEPVNQGRQVYNPDEGDIVSTEKEVVPTEVKDSSGTAVADTDFVTAANAFWYEDTYLICFCNDFADPASISNLEVILPYVRTIGSTAFNQHEQLNIGHILTISGDLADPNDNFMGQDENERDDFTPQVTRNAWGLFWTQNSPYQPFKFTITRSTPSSEVTVWRASLLTKYLIDKVLAFDESTATTVFADGALTPATLLQTQVRFTWNLLSVNPADSAAAPVESREVMAVTPWVPVTASNEEILEALMSLQGAQTFRSASGIILNPDPYTVYNVFREGDITLSGSLLDGTLTITTAPKLNRVPIKDFNVQLGLECTTMHSSKDNLAVIAGPFGWVDQISGPVPPYTNARYRITLDSSVTNFKFGVGGVYTVEGSRTMTAAAFMDAVNAVLGYYNWPNFASSINAFFDGRPFWLPDFHRAVRVSGTTLAAPFEVEFIGEGFAGYDHDVTIGLPGSANVTLTVPQEGSPGATATLTLSALGAKSGSVVLSYDGEDQVVNFDDSAADLTTIVEELVDNVSAVVSATGGPIDNAAVVLTLTNANYLTFTAVGSFNNTNLTAAKSVTGGLINAIPYEYTQGAGPGYFNNANNWSEARVPSSEDTMVIDDATQPIRFGIDQSTTFVVVSLSDTGLVESLRAPSFIHTNQRAMFENGQKVYVSSSTLLPAGLTEGYWYVTKATRDGRFSLSSTPTTGEAIITNSGTGTHSAELREMSLEIFSRFAGRVIGLPNQRATAGSEYLPRYLRMHFDTVFIGVDEGDGVTLCRIDAMTSDAQVVVYNTGSSDDPDATAVMLLLNSAAAVLDHRNGSVGICLYAGEQGHLQKVIKASEQGELTLSNSTVDEAITNAENVRFFRSTVGGIIHTDG